MTEVKALFFDVGGTVFDWKNTAKAAIDELAREHGTSVDSEAFAVEWRTRMFRVLTEVRQGNRPWMSADVMHLQALDEMVDEFQLLGDIEGRALVRATWHRLRPFPGSAEAIDRLRARYTVVVLTVLSYQSIVYSSKAAGIHWDGILSCELLGAYKPSLEAYRAGVRLLGLDAGEAMMVAAHEGDLAAAAASGMRTALVRVPEKDHVTGFGSGDDVSFDHEVADFEALCAALGA